MNAQLGWTSLEQSKKLVEAGLDPNTADMMYKYIGGAYENGETKPLYDLVISTDNQNDTNIPCWSLGVLIGVLPNNKKETTTLSRGGWRIEPIEYLDNWWCEYEDDSHAKDFTVSADNPVDACVEMIMRLNELKIL